MILLQWIERMANANLPAIFENGFAKHGHNGPYFDQETALRNTGHWLITFSRLHQATSDASYQQAARVCADYLLRDEHRPAGFTFLHRNKEGKDRCNGLIGQAWTIESLVEASSFLSNEHFRDLAEKVFLFHDYDEDIALWYRREVDGTHLSADLTFNHQLWFAAAGALIQTERVNTLVTRFLDKLEQNLVIYDDGLIWHPITVKSARKIGTAKLNGVDALLRHARFWASDLLRGRTILYPPNSEMYKKCVGYHAFNTYAFALLKQAFPGHPVWDLALIQDITGYLETDDFRERLEAESKYGFRYNAPGFEVPYSLYGLKEMSNEELIRKTGQWMENQLMRTWQTDRLSIDGKVPDSATLAARIYEITRLPKEILENVAIG